MTERDKYYMKVYNRLTEREALEHLAEEAAELGKAALKKIRASGFSHNTTPITPEQAQADLDEEAIDVLCLLDVLGYGLRELLEAETESPKWERWAERLEGRL